MFIAIASHRLRDDDLQRATRRSAGINPSKECIRVFSGSWHQLCLGAVAVFVGLHRQHPDGKSGEVAAREPTAVSVVDVRVAVTSADDCWRLVLARVRDARPVRLVCTRLARLGLEFVCIRVETYDSHRLVPPHLRDSATSFCINWLALGHDDALPPRITQLRHTSFEVDFHKLVSHLPPVTTLLELRLIPDLTASTVKRTCCRRH